MTEKYTKQNGGLSFINIDSEDDKQEVISQLQQLIKSQGWALIKEILVENIRVKEVEILEEFNDKTAVYNEDDRNKDQRIFLKKLLELPETQISLLTDSNNDEEDDDPYHKVEDIKK